MKNIRMAGRQRNSFGKAMGDIALPASQKSADENTRPPLAAATAPAPRFRSSGPGSRHGRRYIQSAAVCPCRMTVSNGGGSRSFTIKGANSDGGQIASNTNWNQACERAFADFLTHVWMPNSGTPVSSHFTLINSTSKISASFGPMSRPAPREP